MPDNEITVAPKINTLQKATTNFMTNILGDLRKMECVYTDYGKICGQNLLAEISHLLLKEGLSLEDEKVNQSSIYSAVQFVMMSELNIANKEVFVSFRNEEINTGEKGETKDGKIYNKTRWIKNIECKPQYRGQMKLISKFGVNVDMVYPIWIVREGDDFTYATFKGIEMTPPSWSPKGYTAPVVRVVVPVKYKDGHVEYHIAELDSLATNIKAQIKQVFLGWKGKEEKEKARKIALLIKDMNLEDLLACEDVKSIINSTYTGISKEEMFITKLTLNATKRIMIDYGNAYVRELAEKTYDNADVYVPHHDARQIIEEQSGVGVEEIEMNEKVKDISVDDNGVVENPEDLTPAKFFEDKKKEAAKVPEPDVSDDELPF